MKLTPAQVEHASGIPARTIRRWVLHERITDHSTDGRMLVDVDEVLELADLRDTREGKRLPFRRTVA